MASKYEKKRQHFFTLVHFTGDTCLTYDEIKKAHWRATNLKSAFITSLIMRAKF